MKEKDILIKQAEALYDLTKDTCEMSGGTFVENLDGAKAYFKLEDKCFVMSIERKLR